MLRFRDIKNAQAAGNYYGKSDGGYYLDDVGLRREVGGEGAKLLGLETQPNFEEFTRLLAGQHPQTGEQLTAKLVEHRIAGWDITASIPKGVTIALEQGDERIHEALWEAGRETMQDLEKLATTRERVNGAQQDRVTGNIIWYGFEHPETRPAKSDHMPDPDRHIHFVIPNETFDPVEQKWKAIKFRPIMDLRKYFDRRFDMRLAKKLTDLGYRIETKWKPDEKGREEVLQLDIQGIPESAVTKFSRRTTEVEELAEELGIGDAVSKDKLGATSRLHKRDDLTLEDYRRYWNSRLTPAEEVQIEETITTAMSGIIAPPEQTIAQGVTYALQHHFERRSVLAVTDLAITAMERSMGIGLPEEIEPEAVRQGLLIRNGECTTEEVLTEERQMVALAQNGRGTCRPLAPEYTLQREWLDPGQIEAVRKILSSADKYQLIRGYAGTGKTTLMQEAAEGIAAGGKRVIALSQNTGAVEVLKENGFQEASTVARFLVNPEEQQAAQGQVLFVDEASQIGSRTLRQLFEVAERLEMRVALFGDKRQHGSIERGTMLGVLEDFAGLPVRELTEIRRQEDQNYKAAVKAFAQGEMTTGFDILDGLGCIRETPVFDHNQPLIDDYLAGVRAHKSQLIIAPTHREGNEITVELRKRMQGEGLLGNDERTFDILKPLGWTEAERGDVQRFEGLEILQFHRNSGPYRAGERVTAERLFEETKTGSAPSIFLRLLRSRSGLASGDRIRITHNGADKSGKHRLINGSQYTVKGFTAEGDIALSNGWVLDRNFGHLAHGLVSTSFSSQGKTVQRVLIAMGHESKPAISAEQMYVSVSRGKEQATIYSACPKSVLREAIQRQGGGKAALELMRPLPTVQRGIWSGRAYSVLKRARENYHWLRERVASGIREIRHSRGGDHVR